MSERPKKKAKATYVPNPVEEQIESDLEIRSDLQHEFSRQAALYAHYGFQYVRAQDESRKREERLELKFGQLYAEYRGENPSAKENDCKAYIRDDGDYKKHQSGSRRALYNEGIFKIAVKAFEMKASMLQQLGPLARAELSQTSNYEPSEQPRYEPPEIDPEARRAKVEKASEVVRKTYKRRRDG